MEAVCYRHPQAAAVAVCIVCGKSICSVCLLKSHGSIYCGPECAKRSRAEADRVHRELEMARRGPGVIAWLIRLAVVAAVVLAVLEWLGYINIVPWF